MASGGKNQATWYGDANLGAGRRLVSWQQICYPVQHETPPLVGNWETLQVAHIIPPPVIGVDYCVTEGGI